MATPQGYNCPACKAHHKFVAYVFAHMTDRLTHKCDCGSSNTILQGRCVKPKPARAEGKK